MARALKETVLSGPRVELHVKRCHWPRAHNFLEAAKVCHEADRVGVVMAVRLAPEHAGVLAEVLPEGAVIEGERG
jgi:hypothetical protein